MLIPFANTSSHYGQLPFAKGTHVGAGPALISSVHVTHPNVEAYQSDQIASVELLISPVPYLQ